MECQRMIFRWTEETRAADASLSTCVSACVGKARARSRPATFGGAPRAPNGARDARRSALRLGRDVPCMAGRVCVVFGRVRRKMAPRDARNVFFGAPIRRAAAKRACAGTRQKSQRYINQGYPAKCREISRALDRHRGRKTERSKAQRKWKSPNYPRVADWTSQSGVSRNARKCPMSVKTRRR